MNTSIQEKTLHENVIQALAFAPDVPAEQIGVATEGGIVTLTGRVPTYAAKLAAQRAALAVHGVRGLGDDLEVTLSGDQVRDDTDIARDAVFLLDHNLFIPKQALQVKVMNGHVTLSGEVNWHYERCEAEDAIRPLLGVRGVNNRITIKANAVIDPKEVTSQINRAFHRHATLDALHIDVQVSGRDVTLTGQVSTWPNRAAAEYAAWCIPGVQKVNNELTVAP